MTDISTVRTDIYTAFYNTLAVTSATKITNASSVHPSYNNRQTIREGYPQVVVHEPTVMTQRLTLGGSEAATTVLYRLPFSIRIDIHHNSAANARTVADEVYYSILKGKETLRVTNNLYDINFNEDNISVVEYTQRKSNHIYTINVTGLFMDTS